jgi:hypothetical protein
MLPFFAIEDTDPSVLRLRADDPNLYGIYTSGLLNSPVVMKSGQVRNANKGYNFYSAPWCIPTLSARDLGRRQNITSVHPSVTAYITSLYGLIGTTPIALTDWNLEQEGYVKAYQILEGSRYVQINTRTYFGAAALPNTQVSGVDTLTTMQEPLITNDFTFNGTTVPALRLPYNTFYAIDTPIVLSALDANNTSNQRIYFTLLNTTTLTNNPV